MKASVSQALVLLRSGAIPHCFSNVRWITNGAALRHSVAGPLMSAFGMSAYHLSYEQFLQDSLLETRKLSAHLGVEKVVVDPRKLTMQKQANAVNAEFKARFLADFRTAIADGP